MKILKSLCNHRIRLFNISKLLQKPRTPSEPTPAIWTIQTALKMSCKCTYFIHNIKSCIANWNDVLLLQMFVLATILMCIHASSTEVLNVNCSSADNIKFNDDAIVNGSLEYHTVALNITHPVLNTEEGYLYGVTYTGKTLTLFHYPYRIMIWL